MANALYSQHREDAATGAFDWTDVGRTFKFQLVDSSYTFDESHVFRSSIPNGARDAISPAIVTDGATDGYLRADDLLMSGVTLGFNVNAVVLFEDLGGEGTDKLMAYFDTLAGLPYYAQETQFYFVFDIDSRGMYRL